MHPIRISGSVDGKLADIAEIARGVFMQHWCGFVLCRFNFCKIFHTKRLYGTFKKARIIDHNKYFMKAKSLSKGEFSLIKYSFEF